jgi:diphosphomevalonate decarboxylase
LKQNNKLLEQNELSSGTIEWHSPSNIALIKYWGKYGNQLPQNPSISLSLQEAVTKMSMSYAPHTKEAVELEFRFNDQVNDHFEKKIRKFLLSLDEYFPFLKHMSLKINSVNTFPHSAGIASSASSMSALALCLCSLEEIVATQKSKEEDFFRKASFIARLGSGSASRSVYGGWVLWGESPLYPTSSNEYAIPVKENIHPVFDNMQDAILIVSDKEKKVSSTQGHQLMLDHPFAESRFNQARMNLKALQESLKQGDWKSFIRIVENEALSLHAMMMTSSSSFLLMEANTIHIIDKIRFFRKENKVDLCFTLDAGPNIHLLYDEKDKQQVHEFIESDLHSTGLLRNWINDCIGSGPKIYMNE